MSACTLLTVAEMAEADAFAVEHGVPGERLMEHAGAGTARAIQQRWTRRKTLVLCGPGNNGGDGWVIARVLAEQGWPIRVATLVDRAKLKGDAALHAERWTGEVSALDAASLPALFDGQELVVDALFGAGLARPLEGAARAAVEEVARRHLDCAAVDVPSGVDGDSGQVLGAAAPAKLTATFFRRKPGHLLMPGRALMGEVAVIDIGIPAAALEAIGPRLYVNGPPLWHASLPRPKLTDHKYTRGHVTVVGGGAMSGAARMAGHAARRAGAGLVTIAAPADALPVYAGSEPGFLLQPVAEAASLRRLLEDKRRNAILIGPGSGVNDTTRQMVLTALAAARNLVLDADALTAFAVEPDELFAAIRAPTVFTPHQGEFTRLFGGIGSGGKIERAREAAARSGAVVLLKGADTVVAAPDGRAVINDNAPPTLATAGAGDVLAGFIVALMAQGMDAFDAAAAGCWLHGAAAARFGPGLIAEDIAEQLPRVLAGLHN
ncbi:MAG: NAD(P)H-hydrate dehydratase [Alphaproteobacteria bacterium]|nr:NAD(P)H-hydrate dehydratase [Alphaproteobacteria bacterium]